MFSAAQTDKHFSCSDAVGNVRFCGQTDYAMQTATRNVT